MPTAQDAEIVIRSLLFCPANEPRKVAKLSLSGADAGVLDIEDAVASREKPARAPACEPLSRVCVVSCAAFA